MADYLLPVHDGVVIVHLDKNGNKTSFDPFKQKVTNESHCKNERLSLLVATNKLANFTMNERNIRTYLQHSHSRYDENEVLKPDEETI